MKQDIGKYLDMKIVSFCKTMSTLGFSAI